LSEPLRITLSPTARDSGIIVDKDVGAVRDGLALVKGIHKQKEFTILIAGRVEILLVVPAELPVIEQRIPMAIRRRVWIEPRRKYGRYRGRIPPEFNAEEIGRIVPGGTRVESRLPFGVSG
jgi:hypothetical protein